MTPPLMMPDPEEAKAYPWISWSEFRDYWGEIVREQVAQGQALPGGVDLSDSEEG